MVRIFEQRLERKEEDYRKDLQSPRTIDAKRQKIEEKKVAEDRIQRESAI